MKKKIIYFCAGVLLTALALVTIRTFAAAPNPGHDLNQTNFLTATFASYAKTYASATYRYAPGGYLPYDCNMGCSVGYPGTTCIGGWSANTASACPCTYTTYVTWCDCEFIDTFGLVILE